MLPCLHLRSALVVSSYSMFMVVSGAESAYQSLKGLEGFDPQMEYATEVRTDSKGVKHGYVNGREVRLMRNTGIQMGVISNLITDMTLAGANDSELAAAVRHSMVVIDAEKHSLDYKQSEIDNNIAALHKKYQGKSTGGAATILPNSERGFVSS